MRAPLKIEFPSEMLASATISKKWPPGFHHKIRYAKPTYVHSREAHILQQSFGLELAYVELFECRVSETITVSFLTSQPDLFFVYILNGRFSFFTSDGKQIVSSIQGQYYADYTPAGHYRITLSPGNHTLLYFSISAEWLKEITGSFSGIQDLMNRVLNANDEIDVFPHDTINTEVEMLLYQLEKCRADNKMKLGIQIYGIIERLISLYNNRLENTNRLFTGRQKELLSTIRRYIIETIQDGRPDTIEELANRFKISPRTLRKWHADIYGNNLQAFITRQRMHAALKMLTEETRTIADISEKLGFFSPSAFSHQFTKFFGSSPTSLRRKKE